MERNTVAVRLEALEKLQELDGDKETLEEARKCIQHPWVVVEMYGTLPEHVYVFRHKDTAQAKIQSRIDSIKPLEQGQESDEHWIADDYEFYILPGE